MELSWSESRGETNASVPDTWLLEMTTASGAPSLCLSFTLSLFFCPSASFVYKDSPDNLFNRLYQRIYSDRSLPL